MTGQRLDRAALIDAMGAALTPMCDCADCNALRLDAILPLIADAIEAERPKDTRARLPFDDGYDAAVCTAARLVRSLLGTDGDR